MVIFQPANKDLEIITGILVLSKIALDHMLSVLENKEF